MLRPCYNDRMAKKNITSRDDGVTKDMQPEATRKRVFRFPGKMEVTAASYQEALAIYKKSKKQ